MYLRTPANRVGTTESLIYHILSWLEPVSAVHSDPVQQETRAEQLQHGKSDAHTLWVAAQVSRKWQCEAEKLLWRNISDGEMRVYIKRMMSFTAKCNTEAARVRLLQLGKDKGSYVRTLYFTSGWDILFGTVFPYGEHNPDRRATLRNVKDLHLDLSHRCAFAFASNLVCSPALSFLDIVIRVGEDERVKPYGKNISEWFKNLVDLQGQPPAELRIIVEDSELWQDIYPSVVGYLGLLAQAKTLVVLECHIDMLTVDFLAAAWAALPVAIKGTGKSRFVLLADDEEEQINYSPILSSARSDTADVEEMVLADDEDEDEDDEEECGATVHLSAGTSDIADVEEMGPVIYGESKKPLLDMAIRDYSPKASCIITLCATFAETRDLLSSIAFNRLTHLHLTLRNRPSQGSFANFLHYIGAELCHLRVLELNFPPTVQPNSYWIDWSVLGPLENLTKLEQLEIYNGPHISLRNPDLQHFAYVWPHLRVLKLVPHPELDDNDIAPRASSVFHLVEQRPSLVELVVPFILDPTPTDALARAAEGRGLADLVGHSSSEGDDDMAIDTMLPLYYHKNFVDSLDAEANALVNLSPGLDSACAYTGEGEKGIEIWRSSGEVVWVQVPEWYREAKGLVSSVSNGKV